MCINLGFNQLSSKGFRYSRSTPNVWLVILIICLTFRVLIGQVQHYMYFLYISVKSKWVFLLRQQRPTKPRAVKVWMIFPYLSIFCCWFEGPIGFCFSLESILCKQNIVLKYAVRIDIKVEIELINNKTIKRLQHLKTGWKKTPVINR